MNLKKNLFFSFIIGMVLTTTACQPTVFNANPNDNQEGLVVETPDTNNVFEVASGGSIESVDSSSELILDGTVGSPVETATVSDSGVNNEMKVGFWSLVNWF